MLVYVESRARENPLTQGILANVAKSNIIEIQHYKDLFDKNIGNFPIKDCIILAKQDPISILPAPLNYGFPGSKSFFFKPSINCLFDCSYCYLKTMFKNRFPVIFVNYDEIKQAIMTTVQAERKNGYFGKITFYASNYADLRAIESLSHFHKEFIPFFEQFENVMMETRTKSNIPQVMVSRDNISTPKNTEIAFSLSPAPIAKLYEPNTASIKEKIETIIKLINKGYRVGLRFLPLIPIKDYEKIYQELLDQVKDSINLDKINSIAIAPLIESKKERNADFFSSFEKLFNTNFPTTNRFRDYQ